MAVSLVTSGGYIALLSFTAINAQNELNVEYLELGGDNIGDMGGGGGTSSFELGDG